MKRLVLAAAIIGALACPVSSPALHAVSNALIVSASGPDRTGQPEGFTLGGAFTVGNNAVLVTALGAYDGSGSGLTVATPVAIWTGDGHADGGTDPQLTLATVPTGTSATLVNGFRYITLGTPVTLLANQTYTIGAYYSPSDTDKILNSGSTMTLNSDFTAVAAEYTGSNTLGGISEPNGATGLGFYIGPNFEFLVLPEPSSLLLLAASGFGLILGRKLLRLQR